MSTHGCGVSCPVGCRTIEWVHQMGTNPKCGFCVMVNQSLLPLHLRVWYFLTRTLLGR